MTERVKEFLQELEDLGKMEEFELFVRNEILDEIVLSQDTIDKYSDILNLGNLRAGCFPEDFIVKHFDKLHYGGIDWTRSYSEDFLRKVSDSLDGYDWSCICKHQILSGDFIREFQDVIDWRRVSKHQNLSEELIREFQDEVDWKMISKHQILSVDFVIEFSDKLKMKRVLKNMRFTDSDLKNFINYMKKRKEKENI